MTDTGTEPGLDLERFRELVAAYGADFERWPDHERARGRALVEASPDARAALAEERALDEALGELPEPSVPAELAQRLAAIPAGARPRRFPARSLRFSAIGWAAAAALGLFLGARTAAFDDAGVALGTETPAVTGDATDTPPTTGDATDTLAAEGDATDARSAEAWTEEDESIALALGAFGALEEEP